MWWDDHLHTLVPNKKHHYVCSPQKRSTILFLCGFRIGSMVLQNTKNSFAADLPVEHCNCKVITNVQQPQFYVNNSDVTINSMCNLVFWGSFFTLRHMYPQSVKLQAFLFTSKQKVSDHQFGEASGFILRWGNFRILLGRPWHANKIIFGPLWCDPAKGSKIDHFPAQNRRFQ